MELTKHYLADYVNHREKWRVDMKKVQNGEKPQSAPVAKW